MGPPSVVRVATTLVLVLCLLSSLIARRGCAATTQPNDSGNAVTARPALRFSRLHGDGMVLQSAPQQAAVWGFSTPSDTVAVTFAGKTIETTTRWWRGNHTWVAVLPPTTASFEEHTITATSASTRATITLSGVLFGAVWVCAGQSDMDTDINGVNNSVAEEASMMPLHTIRMCAAFVPRHFAV